MNRRQRAELSALLWAAIEECEPMADVLKDAESRQPDGHAFKLVIGDFDGPPNWDGSHKSWIVLDLATGRRIMVEAERIIRERLVELGQMDKSELTVPSAFAATDKAA